MLYLRAMAGTILIFVGVYSLLDFEGISRLFLFLSPDRHIVPYTRLQLRLCLIAATFIGIYLVWLPTWNRLLHHISRYFMRLESKRFLICVLLTGLILRVAVALFGPFHLWIDYLVYDELAATWAATGGYLRDGLPTAYRPPGYPFFLSRLYALFGHYPQLGVTANVLLSLLIIFLACRIARLIWNDRVARWTAIIVALFPSQILFVNLLASETLFTALFLASLTLILSVTKWHGRAVYKLLPAGILLGLATLTRSLTQVYLVLPMLYWYLRTKNIRSTLFCTLVALLGFLAVVLPWMARNYHHKDSFVISTNTGINLLIGNQPGSGMGWNQAVTEEFDFGDPRRETYIDSVGRHRAWQYIKSDPTAFLKRALIKILYLYAGDIEGIGYELTEAANSNAFNRFVGLGLIAETYYLLVLFFALAGIMTVFILMPSSRHPGAWLLLMTLLYWTAVHAVFFGEGRFHFPLIPFLAAFAAVYIDHSTSSRKPLEAGADK